MSAAIERDDRDALAAEFAMGLLTGGEMATAARLTVEDAEFAALVANWQERFSALDATAPNLAAPPDLWSRIETAIAQPVETAPIPEVGRLPAAVLQTTPSLTERLSSLWHSVGFWRPAGLVAAMASLALAVGLGFAMREAARQPVLVAVLMTDGNQPGAVVNVSADGRAELVPLGDIPVPAGRALQIWTLWDKVRGPVSVGLSRSARRLTLDVKSLPRTTPQQLFEITLEPETGSPTGRPTGPILMKGNATTAL